MCDLRLNAYYSTLVGGAGAVKRLSFRLDPQSIASQNVWDVIQGHD